MSEVSPGTPKGDLRHAAAIIALAMVMVGAVALLYFLIDILLLLFLGIVVAAALQPGYVWLSRWGVPKGLAVLLIYLVFLVSLVLIAV
jgi:predicted PurR-regulated permease PerM